MYCRYSSRLEESLWTLFWLVTTMEIFSAFLTLTRACAEAMPGSTYDFDGSIPRARGEGIFGDWTPRHRECFSLMFMEVRHGKFVNIHIVELNRAIAACGQQLVLVDLGPGEVILGIVGVEAS